MEPTKYIWKNGKMIPWEDATTHVLSHALHYGSGAFEGIRAYNTPKGSAIFRLQDHTDRLFYSAKALGMKIPFSAQELNEATLATVRDNNLESGYIRPLAYYGYGKMGINPVGAPVDMIIACWPWGSYLGQETINVKTSSYIRIHPQSTIADAKISGHYVNSIMASLELQKYPEYQEALLLDYEGKVAEGPGENLFIVKNKTIYTPKTGTILVGITRDTVMHLAKEKGYEVIETVITKEDILGADEAFFTGTAAEVIGVVKLDNDQIGNGEMGPITKEIRGIYMDLVGGKIEGYDHWLSYVHEA